MTSQPASSDELRQFAMDAHKRGGLDALSDAIAVSFLAGESLTRAQVIAVVRLARLQIEQAP